MKDNKKRLATTWLTGQNSCTLVIPSAIAKRQGLSEPSHIVIEEIKDGILIRKLEVK